MLFLVRRQHTLKLLCLGLGELRRETGKSMLVTVDYGFEGFILAAPSTTWMKFKM